MNPAYDIAILGAGPVGQALASMLARLAPDPGRIALIGKQTRAAPQARPSDADDPRMIALNRGSRVLLESLCAWPARDAEIRTIHVSQQGRLGRTLIDRREFGVAQLGNVVAYTDLNQSLAGPLRAGGIVHLAGERIEVADQSGEGASIVLDGQAITARLVIKSDGEPADPWRRDYGQWAVLATARASQPRPSWAFERFTSQGPLAVLPHPMAPDNYAIVWCCTAERARALAELDDDAFSVALTSAFGSRLGRLHSRSARHLMPLALRLERRLVNGRVIAIGNAAQALHPVAGQGLNLGLRDAARLTQALARWLLQPARSPEPALDEYARARRADRWLTAGITDFLPRVFATGLAPVEHLCGLALLALDATPAARHPLARHLSIGRRG